MTYRKRQHPDVCRFWRSIDRHGPVPARRPDLGRCWVWLGGAQSNGYGQFYVGDRNMALVHRLVLVLRGVEIPAGLEVDHLCRRRRCVRPSHLEIVTRSENQRRAAAANRPSICRRGLHPLDDENTQVHTDGSRRCRACSRERVRRWRAARRSTEARDLLVSLPKGITAC